MLFIIVLFLGHEDCHVREQASQICKLAYFEPYLHHIVKNSECAETRHRAYLILTTNNRLRIIKQYKENPKEFYKQWMENDCFCPNIKEEIIIRDIQNDSDRRYIIIKLAEEKGIHSIGPWIRPHYAMTDHISLNSFRKELQKGK